MKALLAKVPAKGWLVIAYAVLGAAFLWSANQPPSQPATAIFIACIAACWLPGYLYSNRHDIARNKVFWVSQGVAFAAALIAWLLITPWTMKLLDDNYQSASQTGGWGGMLAGAATYFTIKAHVQTLLARIFTTAETMTEKKMTQKSVRIVRPGGKP